MELTASILLDYHLETKPLDATSAQDGRHSTEMGRDILDKHG